MYSDHMSWNERAHGDIEHTYISDSNETTRRICVYNKCEYVFHCAFNMLTVPRYK